MYNNREFFVLLSDLSYEGKETTSVMNELEYSRLPKTKDGSRRLRGSKTVLVQRISGNCAGRIEYQRFRENYNRLIAEKYNQSLDWSNIRWFVEQVRPHL